MSTNKLLYLNRRSPRLYFISIICIAMPIFTFYMIFSDVEHFYTEFSSKASAIGWMIFFIVISNILLICILWMSNRYTLEIRLINDAEIEIKTWCIIGLHQCKIYPKSMLNNQSYKSGHAWIERSPYTNAPWIKLTTPNGKTLIVDLQAEIFDI